MTKKYNQKVYIVTSGSYSDYGIQAVFLSEADAEAYIAALPPSRWSWDDHEIETWDVGRVDEGFPYWLWVPLTGDINPEDIHMYDFESETPMIDHGHAIAIQVRAKNPDHAVKIMAEKRAQILSGQVPVKIGRRSDVHEYAVWAGDHWEQDGRVYGSTEPPPNRAAIAYVAALEPIDTQFLSAMSRTITFGDIGD